MCIYFSKKYVVQHLLTRKRQYFVVINKIEKFDISIFQKIIKLISNDYDFRIQKTKRIKKIEKIKTIAINVF